MESFSQFIRRQMEKTPEGQQSIWDKILYQKPMSEKLRSSSTVPTDKILGLAGQEAFAAKYPTETQNVKALLTDNPTWAEFQEIGKYLARDAAEATNPMVTNPSVLPKISLQPQVFSSLGEKVSGKYNPASREISVGLSSYPEMLQTIGHERQHAIEGFDENPEKKMLLTPSMSDKMLAGQMISANNQHLKVPESYMLFKAIQSNLQKFNKGK